MRFLGFPRGLSGKESTTCQCRSCRRSRFDPWLEKIPLEKEMATHFSILARIKPWTEEPGRLQPMGSQRVEHDWAYMDHTENWEEELICFWDAKGWHVNGTGGFRRLHTKFRLTLFKSKWVAFLMEVYAKFISSLPFIVSWFYWFAKKKKKKSWMGNTKA